MLCNTLGEKETLEENIVVFYKQLQIMLVIMQLTHIENIYKDRPDSVHIKMFDSDIYFVRKYNHQEKQMFMFFISQMCFQNKFDIKPCHAKATFILLNS